MSLPSKRLFTGAFCLFALSGYAEVREALGQDRKVAYYRLDKVLKGDDWPEGGDLAKGIASIESLSADSRGGKAVISVKCWHDDGPHTPSYEFTWKFDQDVARLRKGQEFGLHYEAKRRDALGSKCPVGYWQSIGRAGVQGAAGASLLAQDKLPYSNGIFGFTNKDYDHAVVAEEGDRSHDTRVKVGAGDEPWGVFHLTFETRKSKPAAVYLYKAVYEGDPAADDGPGAGSEAAGGSEGAPAGSDGREAVTGAGREVHSRGTAGTWTGSYAGAIPNDTGFSFLLLPRTVNRSGATVTARMRFRGHVDYSGAGLALVDPAASDDRHPHLRFEISEREDRGGVGGWLETKEQYYPGPEWKPLGRDIKPGEWYTLSLSLAGSKVSASIDGQELPGGEIPALNSLPEALSPALFIIEADAEFSDITVAGPQGKNATAPGSVHRAERPAPPKTPQAPPEESAVEMLSHCGLLRLGTVTLESARENCDDGPLWLKELESAGRYCASRGSGLTVIGWKVQKRESTENLEYNLPVTKRGKKLAEVDIKLPVALPRWRVAPVCGLVGDSD